VGFPVRLKDVHFQVFVVALITNSAEFRIVFRVLSFPGQFGFVSLLPTKCAFQVLEILLNEQEAYQYLRWSVFPVMWHLPVFL
jgi:hypothetical protein